MSWWERYQAWQPESSWDRYKTWQLESRSRYVATAVALRALIAFLLFWLISGSSASRAFLLTVIFAVPAILLWWFWYYPRDKAKSQHGPVAPRATHG